jgi:hypothetical protein
VEEGAQARVIDDSTSNSSGATTRTPLKDELRSRPVITVNKNGATRQVPSGLSRKFFGIPVWFYLGVGLFVGLIFAIVAIAR